MVVCDFLCSPDCPASFLTKGLRECNKREHGILALGLTIAFGLFRYLASVSFPAGGMLVDFIVIAIDICFFRWHIDLDRLRLKGLLLACGMCFAIGAIFYCVQFHSQDIILDFAANFLMVMLVSWQISFRLVHYLLVARGL